MKVREAILSAERPFRHIELQFHGIARRRDNFDVYLRGAVTGLGLSKNDQGHFCEAVGSYLTSVQHATPNMQLVVHRCCGFGEECAGNDHSANVQEAVNNH